MQNQFFSNKAMKKLHTADDLEQYVQITNPRVWIILAACAALLTGLMVWVFFGTAATTVATSAVTLDGKTQSFLTYQEFQLIRAGDRAFTNDAPWTVSECSSVPLSRDEAFAMIGSDYLFDKLIKTDKSYLVTFAPEQGSSAAGENGGTATPVSVIIHTQAVHPIDLILKR